MIDILIVDDEKIIRKALGQVFKKYGECSFANDGKSALKQFAASLKNKKPFDLVILDISLEDITGLDVLKKIRQFEKQSKIKKPDQVKIIMATGNHKLKMVKACISAGCDNYIIKPLKPDEIKLAMEKIGIPILDEQT